jgi:hypothetical protein
MESQQTLPKCEVNARYGYCSLSDRIKNDIGLEFEFGSSDILIFDF